MSEQQSTLTDVLERNRDDERRRARRALLISPMLPRKDSAYPLVRQHADHLRQWFARETGWGLVVEDSFARLMKQPAGQRDDTRGARLNTVAGSPSFSRRRYALLCLVLADLEKGEAQVTLGRLGDAAVGASADPSLEAMSFSFGLATRDERRDLVTVVRLLLETGVLKRVAGDEAAFVHSRERDVLYDVDRRLLSVLLTVNRGPSLVDRELDRHAGVDDRIEAVSRRFVPDTREARNTELRRRLTARLLDDPVLYREDLDEEEAAYLVSQRPHIVGRLREAVGLEEELRAEGMAMVDPVGDLTDVSLPSEGTDGHATLLVADLLARSRTPVPVVELESHMRDWAGSFRKYWRKTAAEPGAERELVRAAVERLCALGLARLEIDRVLPLPAIGRHALGETRLSDPQASLL